MSSMFLPFYGALRATTRRAVFSITAFCLMLFAFAASSPAAVIILDDPSDTVTLDTLLSGDSVMVGDKLFDNFGYSVAPSTAPNAPAASSVSISPILGPDFGIRFSASFTDLATDNVFTDILLSFDVTATDPLQLIAGATLMSDPMLVGSGIAQVVETITSPLDPNFGAQLDVLDPAGPTPPVTADSVVFAPQQTIEVVKDIALFALPGPPSGQNNSATITFIDQTFRQVAIPEPSTALLALLSVVASAAVRMRKRLG